MYKVDKKNNRGIYLAYDTKKYILIKVPCNNVFNL